MIRVSKSIYGTGNGSNTRSNSEEDSTYPNKAKLVSTSVRRTLHWDSDVYMQGFLCNTQWSCQKKRFTLFSGQVQSDFVRRVS